MLFDAFLEHSDILAAIDKRYHLANRQIRSVYKSSGYCIIDIGCHIVLKCRSTKLKYRISRIRLVYQRMSITSLEIFMRDCAK